MTEIRTIHGIPANEFADRGKMVSSAAPYIPFTAMTEGEFKLALLRDQASMLSAFYPEFKQYKQAAVLFDNALNAGISTGAPIGNVPNLDHPILQRAALQIVRAARQNRPASGGAILGRKTPGIHIGEPLFTGSFDHDCVQYATKEANAKFKRNKDWTWWKSSLPGFGPSSTEKAFWLQKKSECETKVAIENILNENMVNASHHLIYKNLGNTFRPILGTQVLTKKILHAAGIGGLSNVSQISYGLMDAWAETAIMRKNASIGAGPNGSLASSLSIAPNAEDMVRAYNQYLVNNPGKNPKFDKINVVVSINGVVVITAITALVTAIGTAIASSAKLQEQLNIKKQGALSTVQGYGTPAFAANETDFASPYTTPQTGGDNTIILIGGAALALYLLNND